VVTEFSTQRGAVPRGRRRRAPCGTPNDLRKRFAKLPGQEPALLDALRALPPVPATGGTLQQHIEGGGNTVPIGWPGTAAASRLHSRRTRR